MKLREEARGGTFDGNIINETLYIWDSERDAMFPSKVNFRYTLPSHYTNGITGEKSRLPPTFHAHVLGILGFDLNISYGIYVYIRRRRDRVDWWRKDKRYVIFMIEYQLNLITALKALHSIPLQGAHSACTCSSVSTTITDD